MANISVIDHRLGELKPRKRVAAYARVSMETELLLHSLSAQVSYYNELIQKNPEWQFVGVYADEGITGTKTAPRKEFIRLVEDCDAGNIDIVLVKSISRFARDTVDCLNTVRHLKNIGVEVRFERENISSFTADGELMLTLLASIAQAESESIAANVRWATRKRFAEGIPNGHKAPYGYRWDGEMFRIIPEQGEVVKGIYKRYLTGETAYSIAKDLKEKGITGQSGSPICDSTVKEILSNISYTGTMMLQKNYFTENHIRKKNNGELPRYAIEEMFEPLVSTEDYEKALAVREKRAEESANRNTVLTRFSGIIKCGNCGSGVSRRTADGKKKWVCNTRERKGANTCGMRPVTEDELMAGAVKAVGNISDEDFKRTVKLILVFGDRIEFHLINGRVKSVLRNYSGHRGSNPYTNKVFCERCGTKCERDNSTKSTGLKVWRCSSCKGRGLKETDLIDASASFFGENYGGQIVEAVDRILITDRKISFRLKNGETKEWQKE